MNDAALADTAFGICNALCADGTGQAWSSFPGSNVSSKSSKVSYF